MSEEGRFTERRRRTAGGGGGDISEIPARLPVNNSSQQGLPDAVAAADDDDVPADGIVNSN